VKAYLALGSNLGKREEFIREAIKKLEKLGKLRCSSIYETAPWGVKNQPHFLNVVCALETWLSPQELLNEIKRIEIKLGRKARERWGPREIDIDILLYEDRIIETETLTIPHPYLRERRFYLVPLCEIAPDVKDPITGLTTKELLERCKDTEEVKPWSRTDS